jgi:predicted permease
VAVSWPIRVAIPSQTLEGELVSTNYFRGMGVRARLGRTFFGDEDRPVAVLSHRAWRNKFQADPQIPGRTVPINGVAFTIVGVAPEEFSGTLDEPIPPDFWAPLAMRSQLGQGQDLAYDPHQLLQILGRLKQGTSRSAAQAESDALIRQFGETYPQRDRTTAVTLQRTSLFGNTDDWRFQALVAGLMVLVGMVLVVACANVANMLLARGAARQREIGIRLALGAGRSRVIRHLLTESMLLALLGGAGGLVLSAWGTRAIWISVERMLLPVVSGISYQINLNPDIRVFAYGIAVSLITGILFGLTPALQCTRLDLNSALKEEGTQFGRRLGRSRLRSVLVAAQAAVSMMLLISTGLLTRGLLRSQATDPGFETRRVFVVFGDMGLNPARPRQLMEKLRSVPELRSVARGGIPMRGTWTPPIMVRERSGRTLASRAAETYFETLGIPLLRGRTFTPQEIERESKVAVISESVARTYWPDGDAIGKRFTLDLNFRGKLADFEVIGIVRDVRYANLTRIDPAHVYLPVNAEDPGAILMRAQGDPQMALAALRSAVQSWDRDLLSRLFFMNLEEGPVRMQKSIAQAMAVLAWILASIALILAGVGVYGVMSYLVSQRTREIGIRMALGAAPAAVLKSEVLRGLRPVFAGMLVGLLAAGAVSWALHATLVFPSSTDFFYGVAFYDPATFFGLGCFLAVVAAMATALPARRALRVDPVVALRCE